ncbi:hypothetical protein WG901_21795 [Novosphingobium sp. PS1R-30]|uniref:Uncharacterized protein n=1 Tax=Novosphingobium anseongense TaxID=3133436 RepID=A0ABU8S210_9SPHN
MRFDLLKPIHGWRGFLGEVGIIVLGVLLALGAEELLDDWNWKRNIDEQRKSLDDDVKSMWDAMSARVVVQGCVDRRLNEIGEVIKRHDDQRPLGIVGPIGRPAVWSAGQGALRMATADGSLSHMSLRDKRRYFEVAEAYNTFVPSAVEERESWQVLQRLNEPTKFDATDWREIRNAYLLAVDANRVMKYNLVKGEPGQWLTPFKVFPQMPASKETLSIPFVRELCRPALA